MKRVALLVLASLAAVGCDRHVPRVVCHNSNCVEPTNPSEDDTVASLTASLALVDDDDVPLIDGVELDTFWDSAEGACLYAHDLLRRDEPELPSAPVEVLNEHFRTRAQAGAPLTADGGPFLVFIELKGETSTSKSDRHTDEEAAAHASCVMDMAYGLIDGAEFARVPLEITFTSFDPQMLRAVRAAPRWDARPSPRVTFGLGLIQFAPPPIHSDSQPIEDFGDVPVDLVTAHPHWLRRGELQALRDRGLELSYWMFQAVPETFAAIERDRPEYVTTSEASLLRRWLDR